MVNFLKIGLQKRQRPHKTQLFLPITFLNKPHTQQQQQQQQQQKKKKRSNFPIFQKSHIQAQLSFHGLIFKK